MYKKRANLTIHEMSKRLKENISFINIYWQTDHTEEANVRLISIRQKLDQKKQLMRAHETVIK